MYTSQDIREVRRRTGASIEECQETLEATDGNVEKSVSILLGETTLQECMATASSDSANTDVVSDVNEANPQTATAQAAVGKKERLFGIIGSAIGTAACSVALLGMEFGDFYPKLEIVCLVLGIIMSIPAFVFSVISFISFLKYKKQGKKLIANLILGIYGFDTALCCICCSAIVLLISLIL